MTLQLRGHLNEQPGRGPQLILVRWSKSSTLRNCMFNTRMVIIFLTSIPLVMSVATPVSLLPQAGAQLQTIETREVTIELDGSDSIMELQTQGEITIPALGEGPFPGVLLIHGSGPTDRDEYLPVEVTETGNESRPFWQIAEYLSERGFVVLRYDKRGVGENGTVVDPNVFRNATVQQFQQDAEAALDILLLQPEVDRNSTTIIGHSEGAMIAPRIVQERSEDIKNMVLLSASAQSLHDLVFDQIVNKTVEFAHKFWDDNQDSLLSLEEVHAHPDAHLTIPVSSELDSNATGNNVTASNGAPDNSMIEDSGGRNSSDANSISHSANVTILNDTRSIPTQQWYPGIDTNNDTLVDIDQELFPFTLALFSQIEETDPWFQSHEEIEPTLGTIGNLRATSILMLQGEADIQTSIEQSLLLEQKLTELKHPDHTLITYPGLGHSFYPAEGSIQPLGPIQDYVLSDLHAWVKDRIMRNIEQ